MDGHPPLAAGKQFTAPSREFRLKTDRDPCAFKLRQEPQRFQNFSADRFRRSYFARAGAGGFGNAEKNASFSNLTSRFFVVLSTHLFSSAFLISSKILSRTAE